MTTEETLRLQGRLDEKSTRLERDIRELVEIGQQLGAAGGIRGPIPPRLEALLKALNQGVEEISSWPTRFPTAPG